MLSEQYWALPLFLVRDLHWSPSAYGLLALVNTIPILLLEVVLNVSMRNWLHRHALALGALLSALGLGGLAFARGIVSIAAAILVWTFGEMILFPGSAAIRRRHRPASAKRRVHGLLPDDDQHRIHDRSVAGHNRPAT